jgi:MinD superfamily P-loop ATPase
MDEHIRIVVDPDKCIMSGECLRLCPVDAIVVGEGKAFILCERCNLDGLCIAACPHNAIRALQTPG